MAAPRLGLTTSPKPPGCFSSGTVRTSGLNRPSSIFTPRSLGLRVGFGTVIGECPFSVFHHGVQFGFGHYLFVNKQTKAPTERATFDRLGSADRLLPLNVKTGSIPGTRVSDCVMGIKGGSSGSESLRGSPRRLKDNCDDGWAFLINQASLAFPLSSFANIWAQKDSKRSTNELRVLVETNAQSHQCNNIPPQLKLNLYRRIPP